MRAKPAQFGVWQSERVDSVAAAAPSAESRLRPLQALWVALFVTLAVSLLVPQLRPAWIHLREALVASAVACVLAALTVWRRKPLPLRTWWARAVSTTTTAPSTATATATATATTPSAPPGTSSSVGAATIMKTPDAVHHKIYAAVLSPVTPTTLRFTSPEVATEEQLKLRATLVCCEAALTHSLTRVIHSVNCFTRRR